MMKIVKLRLKLTSRVTNLALLTIAITASIAAQNSPRVTGELSQAKGTTLNGRTALAGSTVFNQNLIKTGDAGNAVVSLGKFGRIEIAQNSELALVCNNTIVGGELKNGRTVISAPSGVEISVKTANGVIQSDPKQATILTVEHKADSMRVVAHRGAAKVMAGNRSEPVVAGEEISLNTRAKSGWQRKKLVAVTGVSTASLLALTGSKSQPFLSNVTTANAASKPALSTLFNAGINYSLSRITAPPIRHPEVFFESNITCRDSESILCRRKSQSVP